jgi:hypothetical protein
LSASGTWKYGWKPRANGIGELPVFSMRVSIVSVVPARA